MTDLFSASMRLYGEPPHACIDCVHFAGALLDKGGFLFARRSGYCNVRIKRGDWNVLQRIDTPRQCKDFQEADEKLRDKRAKALAFYSNQNIVFDYLFISSHKPV